MPLNLEEILNRLGELTPLEETRAYQERVAKGQRMGEALLDFTDAAGLTAWLATPGGRGTTRYPGPRLSVTPDP